jgi:hypothetical protein
MTSKPNVRDRKSRTVSIGVSLNVSVRLEGMVVGRVLAGRDVGAIAGLPLTTGASVAGGGGAADSAPAAAIEITAAAIQLRPFDCRMCSSFFP